MRIALIAASASALLLAACGDKAPESTAAAAPDPAAVKAEADKAVAEALAARDADETKLLGASPAVYFVNLRDGMTVTSPVRIVFGLNGMGVAPAGVDKPNTGHHHLLVDAELSEEEMKFAIPNDDNHRHYGAGQTEVVLDLKPGPHTLQLVLGDLKHEMIKPAPVMSQKITINVK